MPGTASPEAIRSASLVPRLLQVRGPSGKLDEVEMEDEETRNNALPPFVLSVAKRSRRTRFSIGREKSTGMDQMFHKEDGMGERQPRYSKRSFIGCFPSGPVLYSLTMLVKARLR